MPDRFQPRSRPCPGRRRQRRLARASVAGREWSPRACREARGGGGGGRGRGSPSGRFSPRSHSTDPCERGPERPRCGGRDVIRVLIAEDQAMVRGALRALLAMESDIEVVAEVARADEVVSAAMACRPDVALMDIEMPGGDGITSAAALHESLPHCRSLILTTFGKPGFLRRAMETGAYGFLLQDAPPEQLAHAIRRTARGERVVDPGLAASALSDGVSPLTERERQVLAATDRGADLDEIARTLYLSRGTVRNHLSNAIQKLGARNRSDAARLAEGKGWL